MRNCWLVLDVNALAHRSWHAMGDLSYKGQGTGVFYGVLRDIATIQNWFNTDKIMFCFDQGPLHRTVFYPEYKANRSREGKESLYKQIDILPRILRDIGFNAVFSAQGYEADDWLAHFSQHLGENFVVLVSRDHDLHQLLTQDDRVTMWDPQTKQLFDWDRFVAEWRGLTPPDLPRIIALTGCKADNIEGIKGVGPVAAISVIAGTNKSARVAEDVAKFRLEGKEERNLKLIRLPWPGIKEVFFPWKEDSVSQEKWNKVCRKFGMDSLIPNCPKESK